MKNKIILAIALISAFTVIVNAEIKNIQGEYVHVVLSNESQREAMIVAENKARVRALKDAFGTIIQEVMVSKYDSETEQMKIVKEGKNIIAGKWLADTRNPEFEVLEYGKKIKVKVWGKAKAVKTTSHNCKIELLREELKPAIENVGIYEYYDKDHFYVKFISPISGYLAIYGMEMSIGEDVNRASDEAYRLLPYSKSVESVYYIEPNKEYILFSPKNPNGEETKNQVNSYRFTQSGNGLVYNRLYFVFSPNEFARPADKSAQKMKTGQFLLPRSLSYDSFNNWLLQMESLDDQLYVEMLDVIVRNTK